jgi:hypothetical protein
MVEILTGWNPVQVHTPDLPFQDRAIDAAAATEGLNFLRQASENMSQF